MQARCSPCEQAPWRDHSIHFGTQNMIGTLLKTGVRVGLFALFVNYVRKHPGLARESK